MRVLLTTHYWWPHVGGIERVALRQAEGLAGRGHSVHVVTSAIGQGGPAGPHAASTGHYAVTTLRAWDGPARLSVPWPVFGPSLLRRTAALVDWSDAVLAHGSVFLPTLAAVRQARRRPRPVVVVQHNPEIDYGRPMLDRAQKMAAGSFGRWTLRSAAAVLVPSVATGDYVTSIVPRRVEVLPWGLDLEGLVPQSSDAVRRQERAVLGVPTDAFLVVAAGRISAKNRFDVLLQAAAQAGRTLPRLHCLVLGGGPDLGDIRALASSLAGDAVLEVRGHVPDHELCMSLRSADVVVATAGGNEGFGLVVAEGLACGVPVVAADRGGHVDLVHDGVNGWLFDGSCAGLASTLEQAHGRLATGTRAEWARRARATVEALTWDRHLDRLEAVLAGVGHATGAAAARLP